MLWFSPYWKYKRGTHPDKYDRRPHEGVRRHKPDHLQWKHEHGDLRNYGKNNAARPNPLPPLYALWNIV
jgi:hypothetical protein